MNLPLINIIPQMHHIIHTLLPSRIAIRIKKPKRVIRTTIHRQIHPTNIIIHIRRRLGPPKRTLLVAIADAELVVITRERFQAGSFHFHRVVDVAGRVGAAAGDDFREIFRL